MNERIRLLEQQALSIVLNGNDPDSDVDKMYIPSEFTKKFALLIVRECARLAIEKQTENDVLNIVSKNPAKEFAYALVEHFGVEE